MKCHRIHLKVRRRRDSTEKIHLSGPLRQYSYLMGEDKQDRFRWYVILMEIPTQDNVGWGRMYVIDVDSQATMQRVVELDLTSNKEPSCHGPLYSRAYRWTEEQQIKARC